MDWKDNGTKRKLSLKEVIRSLFYFGIAFCLLYLTVIFS